MHHMTGVRYDEYELRLKFENHSWYQRTRWINKMLSEINEPDLNNYEYLDTDQFGILDYWADVFMQYKQKGTDSPK